MPHHTPSHHTSSDDVTLCSGAEPSNANFSFPEHFEGKRQSGEMYQKDCLPLLYTFCKFQRLKDKGSQVMLVCLHQHSRIRAASPTYRQRQQCAGSPVESTLLQLFYGSHLHLCVIAKVQICMPCRTLSDAVGRCRTLSDCRTVGLSDKWFDTLTLFDTTQGPNQPKHGRTVSDSVGQCRTVGCRTVSECRTVSDSCRTFVSECRTGAQDASPRRQDGA